MKLRQEHIDADRARAGSTEHVVRYVLTISLVLAVVAMVAIVGVR